MLGAVDDPVAPYEAVRALAGQLSSATLVSWQSGRHGSYPASACVAAAVDGYLLQRTTAGRRHPLPALTVRRIDRV